MSIGDVNAILRQGVLQVLFMATPFLVSALIIGLTVAILQATTSIQEQTLVFVPKVFVILLILFLFGGILFTRLGQYTIELFRRIPEMVN